MTKTNTDLEIKISLKRSLESTEHGLKMFRTSLENAGFKNSISQYQNMKQILIQQRRGQNQKTTKNYNHPGKR